MRQKVVIPARWARLSYWPSVCLGHGDSAWRPQRITYLSRAPLPTLALLAFGLVPYFVVCHFLRRRLDAVIPECRRCTTARLLHPTAPLAILLAVLFYPFGAIMLNGRPAQYTVWLTLSTVVVVAAAVAWWVRCETSRVRGRLSLDEHTLTLRGVDPGVAAIFEEMRARPTIPTQPAPAVAYRPTPAAAPAGSRPSFGPAATLAPPTVSPSTGSMPSAAPLPAHSGEFAPQTAQFTPQAPFGPPTPVLPTPVPPTLATPTLAPVDHERAARERADQALADRAAAGHGPGASGQAPGQPARRELPPLPPLPTIAEVAGGARRFGGPPPAPSSAPARFGAPAPDAPFSSGGGRFPAARPLPAPAEGIAVPGQTLLPRPKR